MISVLKIIGEMLVAYQRDLVEAIRHICSEIGRRCKTMIRLTHQKRINLRVRKVHPVWWDKPEHRKFKHAFVFAIDPEYTKLCLERDTFNASVEHNTRFKLSHFVLEQQLSASLGPKGQSWNITAIETHPEKYFVILVEDSLDIILFRLINSENEYWNDFFVCENDNHHQVH